MTHVLIVSSEPYKVASVPLGGIFQEHQCEALSDAYCRVGIASGGLMPLRSAYQRLPPIDEQNGKIAVTRVFDRSLMPLRFRSPVAVDKRQIDLLIGAIQRHIRIHGRPDILHAHNMQYAALAAHRVSIALDIPFCITEHSSAFLLGSTPPRLTPSFRDAARACRGLACVSGALAQAVQRLLEMHDIPLTLPNILDPQLEKAARAFDPAAPRDAPFTFLAIGRLDGNKNHALLLRAFARCSTPDAAAPAELQIAGAGTQLASLQRLAMELGIASRVHFLGLQNREGIFAALRRAHVLVQTSMVETFGVSIIEALAFGVPVLTTPSGGPCDIIKDKQDGELLMDHTPESLEAAMTRVWHEIERFNRRDIQRRALETYGAESFRRTLMNWYAGMGIGQPAA